MAAATEKFEFLTPIGRLVQGSVWDLNDTDGDGKPLLTQDQKPKVQCYFALAIDKANPEFGPFWNIMLDVAKRGYPQWFDANGNCTHPQFAWKYADGDGVDKNGKPNNTKVGWAGHHVLKFSSSFLPRCFQKGRYDESQKLTDRNSVQTGYFGRVGGLMSVNIGSKVPGLYMNADLFELHFVGDVISSGRNAAETLANAPASTFVPQGAIALGQSVPSQATPGAGAAMPGMAGTGGAAMPGAAGAGGLAGMPGSNVQPNASFTAQAMGGAVPGMPSPTPAGMPSPQRSPQLVPTQKAGAYTLAQYLQNGFTEDDLLREGYFIRQ